MKRSQLESGDEDEHVNGFPLRPDQGSIDLVSPFPLIASILDFLQSFLRLIFVCAGIDRRSILEASSKGG
jgi:hypothetical protein